MSERRQQFVESSRPEQQLLQKLVIALVALDDVRNLNGVCLGKRESPFHVVSPPHSPLKLQEQTAVYPEGCDLYCAHHITTLGCIQVKKVVMCHKMYFKGVSKWGFVLEKVLTLAPSD